MSTPRSKNFGFLASHDPLLVNLGAQAELYFRTDPVACLVKLRQLGEKLAQGAAAHVGVFTTTEEKQLTRLRRLEDRRVLTAEIARVFHSLRRTGNRATHDIAGTESDALHHLKLARQLAVWFHRSFGPDRDFKPGPFAPPTPPSDAGEALRREVEELRQQLANSLAAKQAAEAAAEEEALKRMSAEERAQRETEERAAIEALIDEVADREAAMAEHLARLQHEAEAKPAEQVERLVEHAAHVGEDLELDEAATRRLIDEQLRDNGWDAGTAELSYRKGVRPQRNMNLAIAEWPTEHGPADYVLFIGMQAVAVVEAKKRARDVSASIEQAKRYSRGYVPKAGDAPPTGGPWGEYRVPFLFATNGRPYLRQLETKSGVWFLDARRPANRSVALDGWYTPEGLKGLLRQDVGAAHERLKREPTDYLGLRDYQLRAIDAVESALEEGRREVLVAMATGTGKTRTCIGLCYRLLKAKRFRRILFLVDRTALGLQATNAFKETRLEELKTFAEIFGLKELRDIEPEPDTKLQVATVQGMVKRILFDEDDQPPPVDQYDCIVVDECHRGYLLDRELGDQELTFRSEADYISKYRRVLEHFDCVKIGLTATPALHTTEIFGSPTFEYSYREAVVDGWLVDHEPPIRIKTKLAEDGITWQAGTELETYDRSTGEVQLSLLADEVRVEIDAFNKRVVTENFNRVICSVLADHIDPTLREKTLIFCVTDEHADLVVSLMKRALHDAYGEVEDDAVVKITGKSDRPVELLRRYRNEHLPSIAVTVDLLTTGVDVPKIANLVFIRRVRSRILYHQMLGRATRRCDEIDKEVFRIYDAVDLYEALAPFSDMKPVVPDPHVSFAQLVQELAAVQSEDARQEVLEQLIAKLDRKKSRLRDAAREHFQTAAAMSPDELLSFLRNHDAAAARRWFAQHAAVIAVLDQAGGRGEPLMISHHADELRAVEHGIVDAAPSDYLEGFTDYVRSHLNEIPALVLVTQRPRELTRKQLKELKLALDQAGYGEASLRSAWRQLTNRDIAASIIGYIRQAAIGEPLEPYEQRVSRAMNKILASRPWKPPQRRWLERIGKQLVQETIVDREALDRGQFRAQAGGFDRLNKVFEGKLEQVLGEISDAMWEDAG